LALLLNLLLRHSQHAYSFAVIRGYQIKLKLNPKCKKFVLTATYIFINCVLFINW